MALYTYQAFTKNGARTNGTIDAATQEAARDQLLKQGLYPISISTAAEHTSAFSFITSLFAKKISQKEKILFTKQLAVLLKSGVPLLQALELLIEQFSGQLQTIIVNLKDDVKEGKSLAEGLSRYPKIFDNIYVQLVRAGEATGKLEIILERLIEYLEQREQVTKKIKAALRYPMIQLAVVVLVVVALLTLVVPNLAASFKAQKAKLPGTTQFLMNSSNFIINYWYILLGIIITTIIAFRSWRATEKGGKLYDALLLKLPIVGYFARMGAVVQFSRTLGMLLEGGVNLSEALDIVVNIIDNRILADALAQAREKIIKQGRIAEFLKQTGVFPPIAIYLINTGEQSGQLDSMLLTVAKNYEEDLTEYSDNLSSLLEPVMMLVMGVIVGFIVLSIAQPMIQQSQVFNKI